MFINCILICECIWLFLFSSVLCLFFDTLYFNFFCIFQFFSNVLSPYFNLWVYLFALVFVVEVLFIMAAFSGILLAGDVHSSVAFDRHVQSCQWTGSISLLTWGLLWASACSIEVWGDSLVFLLLMTNGHVINFCHLPDIYFTDQKQIFDDKLKNANFLLNFVSNRGTQLMFAMGKVLRILSLFRKIFSSIFLNSRIWTWKNTLLWDLTVANL